MKKTLTVISALILTAFIMSGTERHIPVIRVEFSDLQFSSDEEQTLAITDLAGTYFSQQHFDGVEFHFDLCATVALENPYAYYGANATDRRDALLYKAVSRACTLADQSVDFRKYDNDNDGFVDTVILVMAGKSEADGSGEDYIWPVQDFLKSYDSVVLLDGKRINSFCAVTEADPLGMLCHEYGHALGLSDYYDTDGEGSGGLSKGMWSSTALMDGGYRNAGGCMPPCFNAVDLLTLGTGICEEMTYGDYRLEPIRTSGRYLRLNGTGKDECYLFECRDNEGWDKEIGGRGMLVYHVVRSDADAGFSDYYRKNLTAAQRWKCNQVNCRPWMECASLVEATPHAEDVKDIFFPQEGRTRFSEGTDPSISFWDHHSPAMALTNMRIATDGSICFTVIEPMRFTGSSIFQDAAIFSWSIHESITDITYFTAVWCKSGERYPEEEILTGEGSLVLDGLEPACDYDVRITAHAANGDRFYLVDHFRTKNSKSGVMPYIYLTGTERNHDGTFPRSAKIPLKVFNAGGAAEVRWYYDGQRVYPGPGGFFSPSTNGTLKAEVYWQDGTVDVIIKEVTLR